MKKLITLISFLALLLVSCKQETYYNITTKVEPEGSGIVVVTPSSGAVLDGTSVSFLAKPNGDYVFSGWSGGLSGEVNPQTVTVSSDLSVTAKFTLRSYPLTITVEGEGTVSEKVISTRSDYTAGTVVELTANPSEHWLFDHWEGDLKSNTSPIQVAVTSAKTVKAVFVPKMYDLTVEVEGEGSVSETVVETKSCTYQEGTIVELAATPATGWSFDHWEGDLSGTENPTRITILGAKSLKAVFTRNNYGYNLNIVGPGAVDEYLVQSTKSAYEYGTKLLLKAYPNDGAEFVGWSGDYTGSEFELELTIDSVKNIVATFEKRIPPAKQYPIQDYSLPSSYLRRLYYGIEFTYYSGEVYSKIVVDYNKDGYLDIVSVPTDYSEFSRIPLGFWLGNPNGAFSRDKINDGIIEGMNHPRKIIYGDFNKDGYPDFCPISHGYDHEPWPGEYPIVVLSSPSGRYTDIRYTDIVGFFHGGASGDFDNDGDLDIFMIRDCLPCVLINDGTGTFSADYHMVEFPKNENIMGMFTADSYDFDHDGYLDLICAGNDWDNNEYLTSPIILYGNGVSFSAERYTMLPRCPVGYGLCLDTKLKDVDGDGIEELFLFRTGDSTSQGETTDYNGWAVQVVKWDGSKYKDVTSQYFLPNQNHCSTGTWHPWWDFEEIDGVLCLISEESSCPSPSLMFRYIDGVFTPVEKPDKHSIFTNGFAIFTDNLNFQGGLSPGMEVSDTAPCYGSHCIRWVAGEPYLQSVKISLGTPADISILRENEYVLEFWVKTTNPRLNICTQFASSDVDDKYKGYGFIHSCSEVADGRWHKLSAPLSAFYDVGERPDCDWHDMEFFYIWAVSEDTVGTEFFLDEIRIRKVLPED